MPISKQIYKPSMTVGQVYAKVYGSAALPFPIGNVLELGLEHDEDVQTQPDMTRLGGGTHAEVRRVKAIKVAMKLADINVTNLARGILSAVTDVASGTAADEPHTATLGGLLPLEHIQPTAVTIKLGPDKLTATPVDAPGNFEVRPEGVLVLADAIGIDEADKLWVSYSYGEYAAIEALTTKAPELQLIFGGLNEADSGKPVVVDIFRVSQGVTKKLALISGKDFGSLDIDGAVLMDPTKTGDGISRYYKARMA